MPFGFHTKKETPELGLFFFPAIASSISGSRVSADDGDRRRRGWDSAARRVEEDPRGRRGQAGQAEDEESIPDRDPREDLCEFVFI